MGGFPSVQVMQSAGRCYRSWARRRLGHGLSGAERMGTQIVRAPGRGVSGWRRASRGSPPTGLLQSSHNPQVMQWLAHWRAPAWAKRRLGHGVLSCRVPLGGGGWLAYPPSQPGYPFSGYPCRWVSSGYPAPGRGVSGWRRPLGLAGGSDSLPPFQRRGRYADCAYPRAG